MIEATRIPPNARSTTPLTTGLSRNGAYRLRMNRARKPRPLPLGGASSSAIRGGIRTHGKQSTRLASTRRRSTTSALTNTVTCSTAFRNTLPAAYSAKLRTAGMGTSAPSANAVVSVTVLSRIDGPIFASVRATRSSAERYCGVDPASSETS